MCRKQVTSVPSAAEIRAAWINLRPQRSRGSLTWASGLLSVKPRHRGPQAFVQDARLTLSAAVQRELGAQCRNTATLTPAPKAHRKRCAHHGNRQNTSLDSPPSAVIDIVARYSRPSSNSTTGQTAADFHPARSTAQRPLQPGVNVQSLHRATLGQQHVYAPRHGRRRRGREHHQPTHVHHDGVRGAHTTPAQSVWLLDDLAIDHTRVLVACY